MSTVSRCITLVLTQSSAFGNNALGFPLLINHEVVTKIAEKHKATGAQVVLAWSQVGGHSVIPKSVTPSRIAKNFEEIKIDDEDIKAINGIGENDPKRYNIPLYSKCPGHRHPPSSHIVLMSCRCSKVGHQHLGRRDGERCQEQACCQAVKWVFPCATRGSRLHTSKFYTSAAAGPVLLTRSLLILCLDSCSYMSALAPMQPIIS